MMADDNWKLGPFSNQPTATVSAEISKARIAGTIEQKAAIAMQNLIDLAQFAVPPATSCSLTASQQTVLAAGDPTKIANRTIGIAFSYTNQ